MCQITLAQALPKSFSGRGIFSAMLSPPWNYDAEKLDIMFITEHGKKTLSPLAEHYYNPVIKEISAADIVILAALCKARFGEQWERKWNDFNIQYNAINDYSITETISGTITKERSENRDDTISNDRTKERNEIVTGEHTNAENGTDNTTANESTFAFNTATATPTDTKTEENTTENNLTTNISDTTAETITDKDTGSLMRVIAENGTDTESRTVSRIGNQREAPQDLISKDIELWKWDFIGSVFADVAKLLTLPIY